MTLKRALQAWFVLVLIALLWAATRASLDKNVLQACADLSRDQWGLATLLDAYFGFAAFFAWVAYKEPRWASRLGWFVALMALGNFAIAAYALIELAQWDPATGASGLLLRRKRAPQPRHYDDHYDGDGDGQGRKRRKKRRRGRGGRGPAGDGQGSSQPQDRQPAQAPVARVISASVPSAPSQAKPRPNEPREAQAWSGAGPRAPRPKGDGGKRRKGGGSNRRNPYYTEVELPRGPERRPRTQAERPSFGRRSDGNATRNPSEPGERD